MTYTETAICQTCGHHFQSNTGAPPPSFNPERTQMLTLPPSMFQLGPQQQTAPHEPINYIEPVALSRYAKLPLVTILVVTILALVAGFYWLLR